MVDAPVIPPSIPSATDGVWHQAPQSAGSAISKPAKNYRHPESESLIRPEAGSRPTIVRQDREDKQHASEYRRESWLCLRSSSSFTLFPRM